MTRVAVVDYGLCNLDSVRRALEECGARAVVTRQPEDILTADRVILPGVGAFPEAMNNLRTWGLDVAMAERVVGHGVPFLGICLGMQLMATESLEVQRTGGLGWIPGQVRRLEPAGGDTRIPHVGWNEVVTVRPSPLFSGVPSGKDFYMVHSYHLVCDREEDVLARTPYCGGFVSAVGRERMFGVQFHPEKSQRPGFAVLRNFLAL